MFAGTDDDECARWISSENLRGDEQQEKREAFQEKSGLGFCDEFANGRCIVVLTAFKSWKFLTVVSLHV